MSESPTTHRDDESPSRLSGVENEGHDMYQEWVSKAACRTGNPDELFVQGAAQHQAKVVCATCPVKAECLADALDNRIEFGVWGGMTERERRALLKRRPNVRSWRRLLEAAAAEHEQESLLS